MVSSPTRGLRSAAARGVKKDGPYTRINSQPTKYAVSHRTARIDTETIRSYRVLRRCKDGDYWVKLKWLCGFSEAIRVERYCFPSASLEGPESKFFRLILIESKDMMKWVRHIFPSSPF